MKTKKNGDAEEKFKASRGWFMKFKKKRLLLYNIKVRSKAARTDIEAATSYTGIGKCAYIK